MKKETNVSWSKSHFIQFDLTSYSSLYLTSFDYNLFTNILVERTNSNCKRDRK